jgi:hypothetical protein
MQRLDAEVVEADTCRRPAAAKTTPTLTALMDIGPEAPASC